MSSETDAHAGASETAEDAAATAAPALVDDGLHPADAAHPSEHPAAPEAPSPEVTPLETLTEATPEPVTETTHEPLADAAPEPSSVEHHLEPESLAADEPLVEAAAPAPVEVVPVVAPEVSPEPRSFAADEPSPDEGVYEPEEEKGAKDEFFEIAKTIFYALLIALVLRVLLFQPFTIPSASMEPNLYEGDYIIVSKWDYGYSKHSIPFSPPLFQGRVMGSAPKRGDVIVFKLPRDPKIDYIKRLIGLPGDTIQVINDQLFINGKAVPYDVAGKIQVNSSGGGTQEALDQVETLPNGVKHRMQDLSPFSQYDNTSVYTVPAGYYFMMGDNRDNSLDSRAAPEDGGVGFVPAENLVGKAEIVLFSWYPGASLWKPWTWFTKVRFNRFFHALK